MGNIISRADLRIFLRVLLISTIWLVASFIYLAIGIINGFYEGISISYSYGVNLLSWSIFLPVGLSFISAFLVSKINFLWGDELGGHPEISSNLITLFTCVFTFIIVYIIYLIAKTIKSRFK